MPARPVPSSRPEALEELVGRTRAGDASALALLYERYAAALFRTALRLAGSAAEAEDVVHDVFVGLPEALRRYDDRGRFEAWLTRVTVRVALMRIRHGRRRREAPLKLAASAEAAGRADAGTEHVELRRALAALPDGLRAVVVLKQIEGYSHEEIGALLGISAGASRVRLARALAALRRLLG